MKVSIFVDNEAAPDTCRICNAGRTSPQFRHMPMTLHETEELKGTYVERWCDACEMFTPHHFQKFWINLQPGWFLKLRLDRGSWPFHRIDITLVIDEYEYGVTIDIMKGHKLSIEKINYLVKLMADRIAELRAQMKSDRFMKHYGSPASKLKDLGS
jgi:hypothetical protein